MDFLSSLNTDTQMVDSQYLYQQDNESSDDFALNSFGFDSQSGYAQADIKNQKDPNLESISEEETPFKLQRNDQNQIKQQIQNQHAINPTEYRVQQLSQQLDNLENETQKTLFEPKNANNSTTPMNNNFQQEQCNYEKGSNGVLSSMIVQFNKNIDEMVNRTEKMMDEYKCDICSYIDNHKMKFKKNAEFLKSLLVAETEIVLTEEERNKIIDTRMQALFKEMVNILNDYQKRK